MANDKLIVFVSIIAVLVSFIGMILTFSIFSIGSFTGHVVENTTVGTINLTVSSALWINFTNNAIDWGSGIILGDSANLSTSTGDVLGGTWSNVTEGLLLENIGNINATVWFTFGKNNTDLLGLTSTDPLYKFNVTNNESNSCVNSSDFSLGQFHDVNGTDLNISDNGIIICDNFAYADGSDEIRVDIFLKVPSDAQTGILGDVIVAGACSAITGCA